MRDLQFLLIFLCLFIVSSLWLTVRQEELYSKASEDFVSASFLHPENREDFQFLVSHRSDQAREIAITYKSAGKISEETNVMLAPRESKLFSPEFNSGTVIITYENGAGEKEQLTLYKK